MFMCFKACSRHVKLCAEGNTLYDGVHVRGSYFTTEGENVKQQQGHVYTGQLHASGVEVNEYQLVCLTS